jgi:FMN phosphatase YigB (HAD superfamily)
VAVSFDLFGTLVRVDGPASPGAAVAGELERRGVAVPDDWERAYRERHVSAEEGEAVSLPAHVTAALQSRGIETDAETVRAAVRAAFEPQVETVPQAPRVVEGCAKAGPVGVCSNCAVPNLVAEALARSEVDRERLDAVVVSVGLGWRKPDRRIFEATADALGCSPEELVHVGDDPETDSGVESVGGSFVDVDDSLPPVESLLEVSP